MPPPKLGNRIQSAVSLSGFDHPAVNIALTGYTPLSAIFSDNDEVFYTIAHHSVDEWEVGIGRIFTDTGVKYLERGVRVLNNSEGDDNLVNFTSGTGNLFVDVPSQLAYNLQIPAQNYFLNGGFSVFQRQAPGTDTAIADGAYGPDRCYLLTQTASVNVKQITGDTQSRYAVRITQNQATAQRFGIAQVLTASDTKPLRNKDIVFQGRIRTSANETCMVAILEWTGTEDTVTKDVVNNWTSTTFTEGNFFVGSNVIVNAVSSVSVGTSTWSDFEIRGTVGNSCNNLIVFVWKFATAAQNYTMDLTEIGIYPGTERRLWLPELELATKQRCLPFCQVIEGSAGINGLRSLTTIMLFYLSFSANFRRSPTFSHNITGYTPGFSPGTTEFAGFNITSAANVTISGSFTLTADGWNHNRMRMVATAGTSFSGSAGDTVSGTIGSGVRLIFDSEL